jgi:O-succinylbenzoic acid--CoA ligase
LGWPLLRTYGLSEAASQVATEPISTLAASPLEQNLEILPHLEARVGEDGRLQIRGASLFTGYVQLVEGKPAFVTPKDEAGWFMTEDLGDVDGRRLKLLGRSSDRIKIGGELSSLPALRAVLQEAARPLGLGREVELLAKPDARLESIVVLVAESNAEAIEALVEAFNAKVLPFERIRQVFRVAQILRTDLGKPKTAELLTLL